VADWSKAREELARWLGMVQLHPAKPVKDIPEPFAGPYFALMPIHEKMRGDDFPTLRNYLKVTLVNIHDEFSNRVNAATLIADLQRTAK
jgi:hypothetical protein